MVSGFKTSAQATLYACFRLGERISVALVETRSHPCYGEEWFSKIRASACHLEYSNYIGNWSHLDGN